MRVFVCHSCGVVIIDRDLNAAAKNIEKLGLGQARAETDPLLFRQ
ncbi:MAG TPA: hypothetical protein VNI77_01030 [Nitrososphaera sp.]|nr:hypothetical protein [Nitrososphaera sp.]